MLQKFLILLAFVAIITSAARQRCFECDRYHCISYSHVCDGEEDCPNGIDEYRCRNICRFPYYFRCPDDGECMRSEFVCDGVFDCYDHSDEYEENCELYRPYKFKLFNVKNENKTDLKKF